LKSAFRTEKFELLNFSQMQLNLEMVISSATTNLSHTNKTEVAQTAID